MRQVAYALNMAMVLCERGLGREWLALVQRAQEALVRSAADSHKVGKWVLDDDAYALICEALEIHDQQAEAATTAAIQAAENEINRRARQAKVLHISDHF
ncbi:hypothetical protein [Trinickia mobilis]|uniref:hypothetical protein n=1 Tax=Trinickia mobilis TaxID=2816356 RepID=UPI001A8DCC60|nr:hypothetical protein [Trinickia mobilis]